VKIVYQRVEWLSCIKRRSDRTLEGGLIQQEKGSGEDRVSVRPKV